jgi:predicted nicotinamide N-methyase
MDFNTILFGDMFYSEEFCIAVDDWLTQIAKNGFEFRALIGDPGRHSFEIDNRSLRDKCIKLFELDFDKEIQAEYPGFHTGAVYEVTHQAFLE